MKCMNELRYVYTFEVIADWGNGIKEGRQVKTLQQLWLNTETGELTWKDVPVASN